MSIEISGKIQSFWDRFVSQHREQSSLLAFKFEAWSFGNTKEMADKLGQLALEGKKTATCSLLRAYKGEEDQIPRVGVYSVLCDGSENPLCIVFLTDTWICKFNEVDEKHAYEEGEGDRSLDYWKKVHQDFFSSYEGFNVEDDLVCERFKVVFR